MMDADFQKLIIILNMIHSVPPFLREKMTHDVIKTLGYKMTDDELRQLHDYINPKLPTFSIQSAPLVFTDEDEDRIMKFVHNPKNKQKLIEFIDDCELEESE